MRYILFFFMITTQVFAVEQENEGDLNLPVTDISQMDRQEQQETPTLDEVSMTQKKDAHVKRKTKKSMDEEKHY